MTDAKTGKPFIAIDHATVYGDGTMEGAPASSIGEDFYAFPEQKVCKVGSGLGGWSVYQLKP